jgi:hypothetical protein
MAASLAFLAVAAVLILVLPRRLAVIPLLLAATYTTRNPIVSLGPANLSVLRVLVLFGILRVIVRRERLSNGVNAIDRWLVIWAVLLIGTSVFHTADAWTFRLGMVLGELGTYFLLRVFVRDPDDVRSLFRTIGIALAPLAALMLFEKATARNFFAIMGAVPDVIVREGHVRATGPFGHAIMAGTVGALCVPMALTLWRTSRLSALVGFWTAAAISFASTSSTTIMMVLYVFFALGLWRFRSSLRLIRWSCVAALFALQMVMHDPVYFLMARIDITGGSTGYYRSQLVRSSLEHLNEWWLAGTDYTRHWMGTGITANNSQADLVNHFLAMGVMGGLPLMLVFIWVLRSTFHQVGQQLVDSQTPQNQFLAWTLGSMLFAEAMGFWAFSPYDQSVVFLYLIFASVGAMLPVAVLAEHPVTVSVRKRVARRLHAQAPAAFARTSTTIRSGRPARSLR